MANASSMAQGEMTTKKQTWKQSHGVLQESPHVRKCCLTWTVFNHTTVWLVEKDTELCNHDGFSSWSHDIKKCILLRCGGVEPPHDSEYDPRKIWIAKIRVLDGYIAFEFFIFIDDIRGHDNFQKEAWQVARWVGFCLQYLGIKDAARKRREVLQVGSPWQGGVIYQKVCALYVLRISGSKQGRWSKSGCYE